MILDQPASSFSWTQPFALVPNSLYEEEHRFTWLNFLRETTPLEQDVIRVDIPTQSCVFLTARSAATTSLPNEAGGEGQHVIPYIIARGEACASRTHALVVIAEEKQMALALLSSGKLQLANIYTAEQPTDVLYYLLKVMEQHHIAPGECTCLVHADEPTMQLLNEYIATE